MSERFSNLKKIPTQPAARLLAMANAKLKTKVSTPVAAPISDVLEELESKGALLDTLRLLSVALPPRERVWWACLAARDLKSVTDGDEVSPVLEATEAWVFKPSEENLQTVVRAMETADVDDETTLCGTAALYAEGNLGPGVLAEYEAPVGGAALMVFAMNASSLSEHGDHVAEHGKLLVDRALDIARGGNGQLSSGSNGAAIN